MAKALADIRSLARVHTKMCIRTLVAIAKQPSSPENARVAAVRELLDRGWGKATQVIAGDPNAPLTIAVLRFSDDEPRQIEGQAEPRTINGNGHDVSGTE